MTTPTPTPTPTPPAPPPHVVRVVHYHPIRRHDQTEETTDQTTVSTTASEIVIATISVAALPTSTTATAAPASALTTETDSAVTPGQALPNQSISASTESETTAPLSGETIQTTVYIESERVPGKTVDPMAVPGRGDFPAPPILDPTTPIGVWDEALADVHDEAADGLAEPQPFVPWTAFDEANEDLTEAAPSLLGAAGLAVVFWMSWNRRLSEEDERRSQTFVMPSPSDN